jgi:5-methyltetrahydropteroyltriglutamate--homocysteine methyltransferase
MIAHNLGYPRIGDNRELKKAVEGYWSGRIGYELLM